MILLINFFFKYFLRNYYKRRIFGPKEEGELQRIRDKSFNEGTGPRSG